MMEPRERPVVVYLDSIDERLLEYLDRDDEVHGPGLPRKATGGRAPSVCVGAGHDAVLLTAL